MKTEKIQIFQKEEYHYPSHGFLPTLKICQHEDSIIRPAVIVCPGGAYRYTTPAEAYLPAMYFFAHGFNAFILEYTVNVLNDTPLYNQPMQDLSRAIRLIRKNHALFHVNSDQVVILGFSAAGHLCASLSIYHETIIDPDPSCQNISNRPDLTLLGYPVITMGSFTHTGTRDALLGKNPSEESLHHYSLESHVHEGMAPIFLFHTVTDGSVPVENSILFARELKAHGVPFALHLFSEGPHGLSTADDDWAHGRFPNDTFDQLLAVRKDLEQKEQTRKVQEEISYLDSVIHKDRSHRQAVPEVSAWMDLALTFVQEKLNH